MTSSDKSLAVRPGDLAHVRESAFPSILYVRCGADPADHESPDYRPSLIDGLAAESWAVAYYEASTGPIGDLTRPLIERLIDRLNAKFVFLRHMIRFIPNHDIIHIETAGQATIGARSIARLALPALVIAKFFGKKAVLHFAGADAETFLDRQGGWFHGILKSADRIVVGSRYLQKAVASAHLEARQLVTAHNLAPFRHRIITTLQPKILLVSPLEGPYNVSCAVKAFYLVKQKYPRAEMMVAGEGSLGPDLQHLVRRNNIWGIEFLGRCSDERLRELYRQADLYLHSASVDESPVAIIRALASGLPVVTTDADGVLHIVRDRQSALIAAVGDHVALADNIIELVEHPELVERLSRQGKREAVKYTFARVRQDWVNVYTELVR
jgi:glycosyltransferase involved in cell wall biosynthesis